MMNSFVEKVQQVLMPLTEKISKQKHWLSISKGLMATVPLTLIAAFVNIIANPPVTEEMINGGGVLATLFGGWYSFAQTYGSTINVVYNLTMGIFTLMVVLSIIYNLSDAYNMDKLSNIITGIVSFLIIASPARVLESGETVIDLSNLGTSGLFAGILLALLTVEITRFIVNKKITIKMPASVPPNVASAFESIIPFLVNILLWFFLSLLCQSTVHCLIPELVFRILNPILEVVINPVTFVLLLMVCNLLWIFGIAGSSLFFSALLPLMLQQHAANAEAFATGGAAALTMYPTSVWYFMAIGGSGCTLGLCLLMSKSKAKQLSTVGKLSLVPGLYSINEPIIFGTPIVLNPILALPFIAIPAITCILGYICMSIGLISIPHSAIIAFLPIGVISFLSTGNIANVIFEIVMIGLQVVLWYPFFKTYEKQLLDEENQSLNSNSLSVD